MLRNWRGYGESSEKAGCVHGGVWFKEDDSEGHGTPHKMVTHESTSETLRADETTGGTRQLPQRCLFYYYKMQRDRQNAEEWLDCHGIVQWFGATFRYSLVHRMDFLNSELTKTNLRNSLPWKRCQIPGVKMVTWVFPPIPLW